MADMIDPERRIAAKVRKTGGLPPDVAIMRALNAAEDLVESYQGWAVDDLEALWLRFQEASKKDPDHTLDRDGMYDMAHEIRGQGGSFGFPLITVIADSLCKLIEDAKRIQPHHLDIIRVHILAMKAVFRQGMKGDKPELAGELTALLQALRERA
jgi:hypothetical protein